MLKDGRANASRARSSLCGRVWKKFAFDVSLPLPAPAAALLAGGGEFFPSFFIQTLI
jgi:hypothetical protein